MSRRLRKLCAQISRFSSFQEYKRLYGRKNYKARYRLISSSKRLATSGKIRRASHEIFSKDFSSTVSILLSFDIFMLVFNNKPYLEIVTFYHYFSLCIARKSKKQFELVPFE